MLLLSPVKKSSCLSQERNMHRTIIIYKCPHSSKQIHFHVRAQLRMGNFFTVMFLSDVLENYSDDTPSTLKHDAIRNAKYGAKNPMKNV